MTFTLDGNTILSIIGAIIAVFGVIFARSQARANQDSFKEEMTKNREADLIERTKKYEEITKNTNDIDKLGQKVREIQLENKETHEEHAKRLAENELQMHLFTQTVERILAGIDEIKQDLKERGK